MKSANLLVCMRLAVAWVVVFSGPGHAGTVSAGREMDARFDALEEVRHNCKPMLAVAKAAKISTLII